LALGTFLKDATSFKFLTIITQSRLKADFSLNQYDNNSFFDISLYQGFNVPMEFRPIQVKGKPGCSKGPRCTANITS
jgi:hypothetical protein